MPRSVPNDTVELREDFEEFGLTERPFIQMEVNPDSRMIVGDDLDHAQKV